MNFIIKLKSFLSAKLSDSTLRKLGSLKNELTGGYAARSWSQEGEDLLLLKIFGDRADGFYVDVGAHHPKRFSNTYLFYKLGWRGINIDANPGSMRIFNKARPGDINLEIPVSQSEGTLTYYQFNEPAVNTFSPETARERIADTKYKLTGKAELKSRTLKSILAEFLPPGKKIDFLTVDVEGLDLDVLSSNDWSMFRPSVILAEDLDDRPLEAIKDSEMCNYLSDCGYELFAKGMKTLFFRERK